METSPAPITEPTPPAEPAPPAETPAAFVDVAAALKGFGGDTTATPETLAEDIRNVGDNPTAETIIGLIQTGLMLIGEEEGILTAVEKDLIRRPLVRVMSKYGVGKDVLPAEVELVLAVLGVVAFRLQKPKTAVFATKVRAWVIEKFFGSRGRKLAGDLKREVGDSVKPT